MAPEKANGRNNQLGTVYVVDDDDALTTDVVGLLSRSGMTATSFKTPSAFVKSWKPRGASCLLLSIEFPTANGLDFVELLPAIGISLPVILMTAHADISWSIRGLKSGAVDFLMKPMSDEILLESVQSAISKDLRRKDEEERRMFAESRLACLSARERQVTDLVVRGLMNKQIAGELNLSEVTVKMHRGNLMRKLGIRTVPDLVRAVEFAQ